MVKQNQHSRAMQGLMRVRPTRNMYTVQSTNLWYDRKPNVAHTQLLSSGFAKKAGCIFPQAGT